MIRNILKPTLHLKFAQKFPVVAVFQVLENFRKILKFVFCLKWMGYIETCTPGINLIKKTEKDDMSPIIHKLISTSKKSDIIPKNN